MTVPFGPRVLPTARSQQGEGERFLDTATRAFAEASGFIEEQRESNRRQQDFESRQKLIELQTEQTAANIEQQSQARMREQAADPRFVRGEEARVQAPASRIPEGEAFQSPFPEAEAPPGAGVAPEIADALEGVTTTFQGPIRPGLRPTGVEGEFFDPQGEQRAAQRVQTQAGGQVRELLNSLATRQSQAGNEEMARKIMGEIENVVAQVEAGNNPAQVVRGVLEDLQTRDEQTSKIAFLKQQLGEDVPENIDTLEPEDQVEELERIQREMAIRGREIRREEARPPTRATGQLTESQVVAQVRNILLDQGVTMAEATDDQIAEARAQVLRVARPGDAGGEEAGDAEEEALTNTRAQASRILVRIVSAAERSADEGLRERIQGQAQAIREQIASADLAGLRAIVERMINIQRQLP